MALRLKEYCDESVLSGSNLDMETLILTLEKVKKVPYDGDWMNTEDSFHGYPSLKHLAQEYTKRRTVALYLNLLPNLFYRGILMRLLWNWLLTKEVLLGGYGGEIVTADVTCRVRKDRDSIETIRHLVLECRALDVQRLADFKELFFSLNWIDNDNLCGKDA